MIRDRFGRLGTLSDRLLGRLTFEANGCVTYPMHKGHRYGKIGLGPPNSGKKGFAHRVAWELLIGPIPSGMVMDHVCRNRACVLPAHLRIVTQRQNVLENSLGVAAKHSQKTQCKQGHLWTRKWGKKNRQRLKAAGL